jgi:integrase
MSARLETVLAAKAGLDHLHPHQFRHTFAHDFLMNGAQERPGGGMNPPEPCDQVILLFRITTHR